MPDRSLPTATPEMVLIGVGMRALAKALPRRVRRRFIREMTETLDALVGGPTVSVVRVIAAHADPDLRTSRAKAAAWWAVMRETIEQDTA